MLDQGGPGLRLPAATEALQAPFEILIEVALDGASGDVGVGDDPVTDRADRAGGAQVVEVAVPQW